MRDCDKYFAIHGWPIHRRALVSIGLFLRAQDIPRRWAVSFFSQLIVFTLDGRYNSMRLCVPDFDILSIYIINVTSIPNMVAMNQIKEFGRQIGREFGAERVILFGSYAQGTVTEDSDVDLLVIGPYEGKRVDRSVQIRLKLQNNREMILK